MVSTEQSSLDWTGVQELIEETGRRRRYTEAGLDHANSHRGTPCRMMNVGHEVRYLKNLRQELLCAVP